MIPSAARPRRFLSMISAAVFWAACASVSAPLAAEEAASAGFQVVTIKMDRLATDSAAGKDIARQIEALSERLRNDFRSREAELKVEEQAIAAVKSQLSQAEFNNRARDFEARARQYDEDLRNSALRLKAARATALEELRRQLAPVLQEIMRRRQAGVMLDESLIVLAARELDVTDEAIAAFDLVAKPISVQLPPAVN